MKIRSGFVSNSSSSSFLLIAFKAVKKISNPADYRKLVEEKYSAKIIKKYALDYICDENVNVDDFDKFPPLFWKEMWKEKKNGKNRDEYFKSNHTTDDPEEYEIPKGLNYLSKEYSLEPGMVGTIVSSAYEDSAEVSADKMIESIENVKKIAPKDTKILILSGTIST